MPTEVRDVVLWYAKKGRVDEYHQTGDSIKSAHQASTFTHSPLERRKDCVNNGLWFITSADSVQPFMETAHNLLKNCYLTGQQSIIMITYIYRAPFMKPKDTKIGNKNRNNNKINDCWGWELLEPVKVKMGGSDVLPGLGKGENPSQMSSACIGACSGLCWEPWTELYCNSPYRKWWRHGWGFLPQNLTVMPGAWRCSWGGKKQIWW